jgi:hypothetical protein
MFSDDVVSHPLVFHAADRALHSMPQANITRVEIDTVDHGLQSFRADVRKGLLPWIKYEEISSEF